MKPVNQTGFTLVELMLAMTLFTAVMVVATVGFIGMNRSYTRGVIRKELSEFSQSITADITRGIRSEGAKSLLPVNCLESTPSGSCPNGWSAVCLGQVRYIWKSSAANTNLYKDTLPCNQVPPNLENPLLSSKYKVQALQVSPLTDKFGLYRIRGALTTKEADALNIPDQFNPSCKGSAQSSSVAGCAVEKFSFVVNARGTLE